MSQAWRAINMIDVTSLPPILSKSELVNITYSHTRDKMRKRLDEMGVPYRCYSDGWPVVSRLAFEQAMGVTISGIKNKPRLMLDNI